MKKLLKFLGIIVAIILVYCAVAILFFDSRYHSEKSIIINAPKEKVWQNVNSMKAINSWSPWMEMDPNMNVEYKGTSGEIGDYFHWKGNEDAGEGEEEITEIVPNEKISTKIHFMAPMNDNATSGIHLKSEGNSTKVTWSMDFELETLMKPMKPYMNMMMNKSFEKGLNTLKTMSEK
ncbi:MAG: SRPBCC family protein [Flavobacteriaceae bacterium]|jgi:uncharacterized protein YndB with AHSA1/START domain|nr:SRPBCC family protein [Flavobacteriaceae bacterium]